MASMFQDEPGAAHKRGGVAPRRAGRNAGPNTTQTRGCRILVKVVPGSRKDEVVGALGERLKIKVAAPPEDGRANAAVCALIAERLGVGDRAVSVVSGLTNPEKVVRVVGVDAGEAERRLLG